jgi:hypothetical protein
VTEEGNVSYDDFVIQIGPGASGGYAVSVVKSPAGEGSGSLRIPFDGVEVGRMLTNLGRTVRGSHAVSSGTPEETRNLSPMAAPETPGHTPREVGAALFRALFSGHVRSLFDQSLGKARGEMDGGLRIQIKLNPEHPDLARLYSLPWELIYRPETQDFLSLSRSSPIVRYLDVSRPTTPYPLPSPLRILVAMASPTDLPPLDLARERHNIEVAWGQQKAVEVVFLRNASPGAIREEMLERPCHVLHFMGHGGFDRRSGEGVLYLEGPDGTSLPVSGHVLAAKLKDFRSLRLVFLNACETARATGESGVNPFAGVATALVLGGIPGVLAMQFPISDLAAVAFSRTFYRRLAAGDPVDTATTEGRQAVHSEDSSSFEWATPVLFLRTSDGNLFSRPSPAAARPSMLLGQPTEGKSSLLGGAAGGAPAKRKGSRRLLLLAILVSLVVTAVWVVASGPSGFAGRLGLARDGELRSGSGAPSDLGMGPVPPEEAGEASAGGFGPEIVLPPPRDYTTYQIDEAFRSSIEGFVGMVSKVELREDRMRWYFHFFNQTDEDRRLGLKYSEIYLADEAGNAYRVLEAEEAPDVKDHYSWTVQVGVRLDRWMDFPPPREGASSFTVGLIPRFSFTNYPTFKPFQVSFPR